MVPFFDVILIFGGIALSAWLAYGPLLLQRNPTLQGLRPISEYFIYSCGFYAVSAVTDYFLHHLDRLAFPWDILWVVTLIAVAGTFILGSETLFVAGFYVRRFGRTGLSESDILPFKSLMQLTLVGTISLISAVSGFLTSVTYVGRTYFTMNVGIALWGIYGYAKTWRNPSPASRKRLAYPIYTTFLWIIVSVIMNIAFGWPM